MKARHPDIVVVLIKSISLFFSSMIDKNSEIVESDVAIPGDFRVRDKEAGNISKTKTFLLHWKYIKCGAQRLKLFPQ